MSPFTSHPHVEGAPSDERLARLEQRVDRQQRLLRLLVCAFLVMTAVVLVPVVLDVAAVLLMVAGSIALVRVLAEGQTSRLFAPVRAAARTVRETF